MHTRKQLGLLGLLLLLLMGLQGGAQAAGPYNGTNLNATGFSTAGVTPATYPASSATFNQATANAATTNPQGFSVPRPGPFDFAPSSTWTIEMWVYATSLPGYEYIFQDNRANGAIQIYCHTTQIAVSLNPGHAGSVAGSFATGMTLNTWHHIAVECDGTNIIGYLDGTRQVTFAGAVSAITAGDAITVGTSGNAANNWLGNIDEVSITSSVVYSGATYTVPSAPFAANRANQFALYHLDGNLLDSNTSGTGPLTDGTYSAVSTATTANITATPATAGTAPYTYQWYRGATSSASLGTTLSGATGQNLTDTGLTANTSYYYRRVTTDSGASSVQSAQLTARTAQRNAATWEIGDSLFEGYQSTSPPTLSAIALLPIRLSDSRAIAATVNNQAASGATSADWLSTSTTGGTARSSTGSYTSLANPGGTVGADLLNTVLGYASGQTVDVWNLMLGTNDAKTANNYSAATYKANIASIANSLHTAHPESKVVLFCPPYVLPTTGGWNEASDALLDSYAVALGQLANNTWLFLAPSSPYALSAQNLGLLFDGVHFTDAGYSRLANIIAAGDGVALTPATGTVIRRRIN